MKLKTLLSACNKDVMLILSENEKELYKGESEEIPESLCEREINFFFTCDEPDKSKWNSYDNSYLYIELLPNK